MISSSRAAEFRKELVASLAGSADPATIAVRLIAAHFSHYTWVGVYWLRGNKLILGPFVGAPTIHAEIAVGQGVCGTAVADERNQIVHDVRDVANYLACSATTRSEIVVLIRRTGQIIGQIDADSDEAGAFDETDEDLLTYVATCLSARSCAV